MGLLIPEDIPLDKLPTSERRVIRMFQSTLKDNWLIIPRVDLVNDLSLGEVEAAATSARLFANIVATKKQRQH